MKTRAAFGASSRSRLTSARGRAAIAAAVERHPRRRFDDLVDAGQQRARSPRVPTSKPPGRRAGHGPHRHPVSSTSPRLSSRATARRGSSAVLAAPVDKASSTAAADRGPPRCARAISAASARWAPGRPAPRAASAAWTSAPMSPITTQSSGSTPRSPAAARTIAGAGLRHRHPSSSPCAHTCQVSNGPSRLSTRG